MSKITYFLIEKKEIEKLKNQINENEKRNNYLFNDKNNYNNYKNENEILNKEIEI